jgi:hypothetical protein
MTKKMITMGGDRSKQPGLYSLPIWNSMQFQLQAPPQAASKLAPAAMALIRQSF